MQQFFEFTPEQNNNSKMADVGGDASRAKRRKIQDDNSIVLQSAEPITSHQQLQKLLAFQQSASSEVKQGKYEAQTLASLQFVYKSKEIY